MATAATPIEKGLELQETADGKRWVMGWTVRGLSGASDAARMLDALSATGIPAIGDSLSPVDATAKCVDLSVAQIDVANAVEVFATYERPSSMRDFPEVDVGGVWRMSSAIAMDTVSEDKDGNFMIVNWSGTLTDIFPDQPALSVTKSEKVEAELARATFTLSCTIRDTGATRIADVLAEQVAHTGTVNNALWLSTFPARSVMLTGIAVEQPNAEELLKTYQFEYRRALFDVVHVIRVYGRIPDSAVDGNGRSTFRIEDETDFSLLPCAF